jgi:hypothetical protein
MSCEEEIDFSQLQHLKEKVEFLNFMNTSGSPNILIGDFNLGEINKENKKFVSNLENKFENEIERKIILCKENMVETTQMITLILKNIYEEISKFYHSKENIFKSKKNELIEMQNIYEKIKLENDKSENLKIFKNLITYQELISTIMSDDEIFKIKKLYEKFNYIKELSKKYNQHLNDQFQLGVVNKIQQVINIFENTLTENKNNFKNFCLEFLDVKNDEYDNITNIREIKNNLHNNSNNIPSVDKVESNLEKLIIDTQKKKVKRKKTKIIKEDIVQVQVQDNSLDISDFFISDFRNLHLFSKKIFQKSNMNPLNTTKKYTKQFEKIYLYNKEKLKFISKGTGNFSLELGIVNNKKIGFLVFRNLAGNIIFQGIMNPIYKKLKRSTNNEN